MNAMSGVDMNASARVCRKRQAARWLRATRFALAGGIAGVAAVNTYAVFVGANAAPFVENFAMVAGALVAVILVKTLRLT